AITTVNGGPANDTLNVGSLMPVIGGIVDGIVGPLPLIGNAGFDVLNVDDTGSTVDKTGTLTATTLTGLGMAGGITYGTLETVNISVGSGRHTLNIQSTSAVTNINGGPANDTRNISSLKPITRVIADGVAGPLTLIGNVGFNVL